MLYFCNRNFCFISNLNIEKTNRLFKYYKVIWKCIIFLLVHWYEQNASQRRSWYLSLILENFVEENIKEIQHIWVNVSIHVLKNSQKSNKYILRSASISEWLWTNKHNRRKHKISIEKLRLRRWLLSICITNV